MPDSIPANLRAISEQLVEARTNALALARPPEGLPETLEEAYRVQDCSIAGWDDEIAGWKVGGVPPSYKDRFSDKRLVGPIFRKSVRLAVDGTPTPMPVFEGGFAAIEPEFIFELGESEADDRMFIGAEIASSPVLALNSYGPVAIVCDFGNNNGMLIGPEVVDWRNRGSELRVVCEIDGAIIGEKILDNFPAAALASLSFLREVAERRGYALPAGTFVSSGAITGVHEALVGASSRLDFGDLGTVELVLSKATAPKE